MMNPETNQLEALPEDLKPRFFPPGGEDPVPEAGKPETWSQLGEGMVVNAHLGADKAPNRFLVESISEERVRLRIVDEPPIGSKWRLTRVPRWTRVAIGRMVFMKFQATNKTLTIVPVGYAGDPISGSVSEPVGPGTDLVPDDSI